MPDELTVQQMHDRLEANLEARRARGCGSAVLIPLVARDGGFDIVLEVRAQHLKRQPGEVCLPGGRVEEGESACQAAVRETCEELLIDASQVEVVGELDRLEGPNGKVVQVVVGVLHDYTLTFELDEVDSVFTLSLEWLLAHEPVLYTSRLIPEAPDDFPWDLVPQGRAYPFKQRSADTYFYLGTEPLIWGFTAQVLNLFARVVGGEEAFPVMRSLSL